MSTPHPDQGYPFSLEAFLLSLNPGESAIIRGIKAYRESLALMPSLKEAKDHVEKVMARLAAERPDECPWLKPAPVPNVFSPSAMLDELEFWKGLALWLAQCHAATAQGEGMMSRTSKSSRSRFVSICERAALMIEKRALIGPHVGKDDADKTIERLKGAVRDLREFGR